MLTAQRVALPGRAVEELEQVVDGRRLESRRKSMTRYDRSIVASTTRPPAVILDEPDATLALRDRRILRLALTLALLPLAVSAAALVVHGRNYVPTADRALIELQTRDVGRHPVLLGLYSRPAWDHPGPILFYLLSVPYRLSGSRAIGLQLGALLINGAAITGMALVAKRRGGARLMLLTLVGCALLVRALGPDFVRDPWNPIIPVLPFGLLIFLVWEMTCGEAWALPVAAGVASFCVQTHVGYAPLAIPLLFWGTGWVLVLARRRSGRRRQLVRAGLIAAAVLAVMWAPPVIEQLQHSGGNLSKLAKYFADPGDEVHSLGDGYRVVSAQFGVPPEWLAGSRKPNPFTNESPFLGSAPPPVLLLFFGWAAVILWRRRASHAGRLVATVSLALCLAVLAVMRTSGLVFVYRLKWTWVLAMVATLVVVWTAWELLADRSRAAQLRRMTWVSIAALLALTGVNTVSAARASAAPNDMESLSPRLAALMASLGNALPAGNGAVVVRAADQWSAVHLPGVVLWLEKRNVDARVEPGDRRMGEHRIMRGRGPMRATLTLAAGNDLDKLLTQSNQQLVAYAGMPLRERARLLGRIAALNAKHDAGELAEDAFLRAWARLLVRLGPPAMGLFAERPLPSE